MTRDDVARMFDFSGRTAVITGGAGVLCGEIARALAACNANIAILDRDAALGEKLISGFETGGGKHRAYAGDVLNKAVIEETARTILREFGRVDFLINGAGGNSPRATTSADQQFFDLPEEALRFVTDLNLLGTILPSQVFGRHMAERKQGVIVNISSMNAFRPLTRIPAYSAAKAAVSNFTQWLAVHMAREYSPDIRVNAIAPGFFLTDQNRFLLTDERTGNLTERGKQILDHTPMGRFGLPADLPGTVLWLLSPASQFITGIVVPIDGGFSAYSGV